MAELREVTSRRRACSDEKGVRRSCAFLRESRRAAAWGGAAIVVRGSL